MTIVRVNLDRAHEVLRSAAPSIGDRQRILRGFGAAASATWKRLAQQELRSTARDYIAGISAPTYGKDDVSISLEGRMPNMVEQGWGGGDMRQWLLTSPKAKRAAHGGRYLTVPFRHGTPGTGGRNVGLQMPPSIHEVVKKLAPTLSRPMGGTQWGGRLHKGLNMSADARGHLESLKQPWHSSSIYLGMVRKAQPAGRGLQTSGYQTFRVITERTAEPGKHWVHPGIKARRIGLRVEREMQKIAQAIVTAATGGGKQR